MAFDDRRRRRSRFAVNQQFARGVGWLVDECGRTWAAAAAAVKKESLDAECVVLRKWITTTKTQGLLGPHAAILREAEKIIKKKSCSLSRRWPLNEPFIYCNQDTFGWLLLNEILRSPFSPYFFPTKKNFTDLQGNAKSSSVISQTYHRSKCKEFLKIVKIVRQQTSRKVQSIKSEVCATKAEWKIQKKERIDKRKYLSAVCDYNWANRKCKVYKSNRAKMRASVAIAMLTYCTVCVLATAPVRPGGGTNPSPRLPRTSASQFPKNSTSRSSTTKPTFRTRWVSVSAFDRLLFVLSCSEAFLLSWHYATLMHSTHKPVRNYWHFQSVYMSWGHFGGAKISCS